MQLLPHCKKDAKLDTKSDRGVINEIADIKVCIAPRRKDCCLLLGIRYCGAVLLLSGLQSPAQIRHPAGTHFCLLLALSVLLRLLSVPASTGLQ